jgi:hypothetical protein
MKVFFQFNVDLIKKNYAPNVNYFIDCLTAVATILLKTLFKIKLFYWFQCVSVD